MSLFHRSLEGRQIDLTHGSLVDHRVGIVTIVFGVVPHVVLNSRNYAFTLHSTHVRYSCASSEEGIFSEVFEVAPVHGSAVDVYTGTKQEVHATRTSVLSKDFAHTLDQFQMVAKKDLFPSQLSGGQQQLVGVARAVIHKPGLLLADEPTGNLHSSQAKEIMELFRDLNQQGTTIVQVTHSEANAAYGSRTIQLRDGWVVGDTANPELQPYEAVKQ